jgi:hypothetical protein
MTRTRLLVTCGTWLQAPIKKILMDNGLTDIKQVQDMTVCDAATPLSLDDGCSG